MEIKQHKHCKICGEVIECPNTLEANLHRAFDIEPYDYSICKKCLLKEGIKTIKKKGSVK